MIAHRACAFVLALRLTLAPPLKGEANADEGAWSAVATIAVGNDPTRNRIPIPHRE